MNNPWLRLLPSRLSAQFAQRGYARRVANNSIWMLAERLLRYLIGFLIGIWIARYLGVEQYGLLSYASAFVSIFEWLSILGLDPAVVRELVDDPLRRDEALGSLLALRFAGGVLMVVAIALALPAIDPADPRARVMIVMISFAQLLVACDSLDCWFQATLTSRYAAFARIVVVMALAAVRVVLIWLQAPIEAFACAILVEAALAAGGMVIVYRTAGGAPARLQPSCAGMRSLLANGWPLVAAAAATSFYQRVDHVMIGELAGYGAVGAYSVAVRFVEVTYLAPAVLLAAAFPALIIARTSDQSLFSNRVQAMFDVSVWVAVVLAGVLWMFGASVISLLFGASFAEAGKVLAVLAWMPLLAFTSMVRARVLMAENVLRAVLAIEVAICVLNVVGNVLLIPRWGAPGAACAALASAALAPLLIAPFSVEVRRCNRALLLALVAPVRYWKGQGARL